MKTSDIWSSVLPPGFSLRPTVIAGPCSAESEEQMVTCARSLSANGIRIFRAGVWKPRTRPGSFEGFGTDALLWLKTVKQETGMLVATEVACEKHVFEALKMGIDILWIGARTTVNTFAVQELAEALRGIDQPVLVKNPVNADLELWIGAIERLEQAGIKKLAAVHRGFSHYGMSLYRNAPEWQIPVELRRRMPHLPLVCDCSHIAGERSYIAEIAQRAMDLSFDGLMIESHPNPEAALSDAKQQLTPADLNKILKSLVIRHEGESDNKFQSAIADFRQEIDRIDETLLDLLAKRMRVAESIGSLKKAEGITILQASRWEQIMKRMIDLGALRGLGEDCVTRIFKAIHDESINRQNRVMNSTSEAEESV